MHQFQPYPMEVLEFNPFKKIGQDWGVIVTERDGKTNGMTASWGSVGCLWNMNIATIFIRDSRFTKEMLDATETFSVNFFEEGKMKAAMGYLGKVSGRYEDKLASARLTVNHQCETAFLDESNFVLICRKLSATRLTEESFLDPSIKENFYKDGDMHTMYIGEIMEVLAR